MSQARLEKLLAGALPDPDGAGMLSVPIDRVEIGRGLASRAAELVGSLGFGRRLAVVMDTATRRALGEAVVASLERGFEVRAVLFESPPHPDMPTVEGVMARTHDANALIAVGSGSVNDIAKHAAHLTKRPYAVFGTAPSMNGYTSVSAAITEHGLKKSLASTAARGVFLDLDVLAAAPKRLIAAGFGDSICRSTSQADWLMSHLLRDTPYREAPFLLLKDDEAALVANAPRLVEGDTAAIALLARTLVMSGFGMTVCGGSYPASQSEHLVAHYIDMLGKDLPPALHGEHIAVTTSSIARLQERVLGKPRLEIRESRDTPQAFADAFGRDLGATCWEAYAPKRLDRDRALALSRRLDASWEEVRARVRAVMRPADGIVAALKLVGAPTTPEEVGIGRSFYRAALLDARRIRDRFGILDLAEAAGELDAFVARETA
ncbi:MAG: sn-glycerol-1-phosphate dehydrogenase [Parvibaculaceae bacterium]